MFEKVQLPGGDHLQFWDDGAAYKTVFHVACENARPKASDASLCIWRQDTQCSAS
jgi:hypothetical protein